MGRKRTAADLDGWVCADQMDIDELLAEVSDEESVHGQNVEQAPDAR